MAHRIVEPQEAQVRLPRRLINVRAEGAYLGTIDRMDITKQDRGRHITAIGMYICFSFLSSLAYFFFFKGQRLALHRDECQEPTATANSAMISGFQPVLGVDRFMIWNIAIAGLISMFQAEFCSGNKIRRFWTSPGQKRRSNGLQHRGFSWPPSRAPDLTMLHYDVYSSYGILHMEKRKKVDRFLHPNCKDPSCSSCMAAYVHASTCICKMRSSRTHARA